jgi:hypothetical protein
VLPRGKRRRTPGRVFVARRSESSKRKGSNPFREPYTHGSSDAAGGVSADSVASGGVAGFCSLQRFRITETLCRLTPYFSAIARVFSLPCK